MNNYKIVIDSGHGGTDNVVSGKDSNIIVSNHINVGAQVSKIVMTKYKAYIFVSPLNYILINIIE